MLRPIRAAARDVLVVDQTRPDVPLTVVRVAAPGLRHFRPRFAPGRLYTVPVALGWQPSPLSETALSPPPPFC